MMDRLKLEAENGTIRIGAKDEVCPVKFYESSVRHALTDEPLLTIASKGRGIRATPAQVKELYDWLGQWIEEHKETA